MHFIEIIKYYNIIIDLKNIKYRPTDQTILYQATTNCILGKIQIFPYINLKLIFLSVYNHKKWHYVRIHYQ